jgi:hypothetical protein
LIAAIGLSLTAVIAVIVAATVVNNLPVTSVTDPLPVSSVESPGANSAACVALMAALPDPLSTLPRRPLAQAQDPSLAGVAAWGDPAVVLRCGLPTPAELTCSASIQQANGVAWLPLAGQGTTSYIAVDRSVRIALTVPDGTGTGPWQEISNLVAATLPERPICVDGVLVPTDN